MVKSLKKICSAAVFGLLCITGVISSQTKAQSDGLDPLSWLDKGSVPGSLYGQAVQAVGDGIAAAAKVRQEAYERQMDIDFAQKALSKCDHCSDEAALKARVDRLIGADEKLHREVDAIVGNTGIAAALHILMDPTGQRELRHQRSLNFENLIDDFCIIASQKDVDARIYCLKSFSMDYLNNQADVAWKFCKDALRSKYGVTNPEKYPAQPSAKAPPDEARDFFMSCTEHSTVTFALMRKIAQVCKLRYEDIKIEAPNPYQLFKTCNPDPGGPPGSLPSITESARKLQASHMPGEAEQAFALFSRMAAKHYPPAMYYAGQALLTGNGVEKNEAAALGLFQQASVRGDQNAMVALALMYKNGVSVPRDYKTALHYLLYVNGQREEGPSADASIVLARMYANGDGVPMDEREAASLYINASTHQLSRRDPNGQVTTEREHPEYSWEAANWLIDHKYFEAAVNIFVGTSGPRFRFEAVKWYMTGWSGIDGRSSPPNLKAASWVLKSYLLPSPDAEVLNKAQRLYKMIPASER